jgi:hypothetical protein
VLVPAGSVWKYLDNGSDQGTAWIAPAFDDSTWAFGPAQLGFGDGDEVTVISSGPDPSVRAITTYFRHSFGVTNTAGISNLTVRLLRDDGGVVYLNGVEVFRSNMPNGPITFTTLASTTVGGPDETVNFFSGDVPPGLLVSGFNSIAVEIHQASVISSDLSFDLELVANAGGPTNPNLPPSVVLTSPVEGATFVAPALILLSASAEDPGGAVTSVDFYSYPGTNLIGREVSAPYNLVWSNVPPGSYELIAVATDNSNEVSASTPVHISVVANTNGMPPEILTQPQSQAVFPGDNVTFFVEAIGTEPLSYRWFHEGAPVLSATNRFLTLLNVQPGAAGNYFVRVANTFGAVTSSVAVLQVLLGTNLPPTVALTSPVAGSTFVAPATILLSASASDPGGAVTSVEFFEGTNHIAGDTTAPYSVIWSNVPPGVYTLTAVAIDNSNAVTVSAAFQITVFPPSTSGLTLVSTGSVWKYLDDGSDQGTVWVAPGFDDSTWASGPAQLGYGDGDEATVVGFGQDPANKFVTTYFRRSFAVTSAASITGLTVRLLRDDGGVVYLNGVEVFRSNMPPGPILFNTLAVASVGGADESTFFSADVPPGLLVNGQNVLAVEIHQNATPSSDLSFDLELVAQTSTVTNGVRPRIVTQPQSQTVPAGSTVSFNVVATGTPPLIYVWFFEGHVGPLRVSTNNVLTLFNVQTNQAGRYSVMVSNLFGRVTSSNAFLQVTPLLPTNHPPSFVKGPDLTLSESDTPAAYRFEPWATNIRPGPTNESGQALVFIVTNDNPGLFATQPAVEAPGGALTLATASHASGTAQVFVVLMDDGGTANGGIDRSEPQVFTINILPANTPPVAVAPISPLSTLFPDQTNLFVISPNNSNALVVLDASASSDAEHDPLQFGWMEASVLVATGVIATNGFDLGVHDLVLVADDGRATGTAQVEFEVISAGDAVESIASKLQGSTLPGSLRRPLAATLTVAADTFDAGNFDIGVHHLQSFQNKVRNRVQPVDPDLAALLTNAAQAIIEAAEPR